MQNSPLPVEHAKDHWPIGVCSYRTIMEMIDAGIVTDVHDRAQVNGASLDLTLGSEFLTEPELNEDTLINMMARAKPAMRSIMGCITLNAQQWCLATSRESFHLPLDVLATVYTKSSMARAGLDHLNAGFCDPGWHGSTLTMELKNMNLKHRIMIEEGLSVVQVKLEILPLSVPASQSYLARGRYNGDCGVTGVKP